MDTTGGQLKVEIEDLKSGPMSRIIGDHNLGYTKLGSEGSYNLCGERYKRQTREHKSTKDKPKVTMSISDRNTNITYVFSSQHNLLLRWTYPI